MARAAVKAKQLAAAKAQPPKSRARGRRRHSGGGNPNQELFFVRLRRHQKWIYAVLAVIFGLSFVFVGVGSGNGGGLSQLWNNIFGGSGSSSISKASAEVQKNPVLGYRQLATAYEEASPSQPASAAIALQQYLQLRPKDGNAWSELAGLEQTQASTYSTRFQSAQQAAQLADPSAPFLAGGTLGSAVGSNPIYQGRTTAAQARESLLEQKATTAYRSAFTDYKKASHLRPRDTTLLQELAQAAYNAGNPGAAARALRAYLGVYPNAPDKKQVSKEIASLEAQAKTPSVSAP
jgi:hypothetical protein